jgi:hypothetical protein
MSMDLLILLFNTVGRLHSELLANPHKLPTRPSALQLIPAAALRLHQVRSENQPTAIPTRTSNYDTRPSELYDLCK